MVKKLHAKDFDTSTSDIRLMTFEELFESRLDYFKQHPNKFSESQFRFLKSIQHYKTRIGLTKKQKNAFICIVDSVWLNEFKR
jgi:hypothetical protein